MRVVVFLILLSVSVIFQPFQATATASRMNTEDGSLPGIWRTTFGNDLAFIEIERTQAEAEKINFNNQYVQLVITANATDSSRGVWGWLKRNVGGRGSSTVLLLEANFSNSLPDYTRVLARYDHDQNQIVGIASKEIKNFPKFRIDDGTNIDLSFKFNSLHSDAEGAENLIDSLADEAPVIDIVAPGVLQTVQQGNQVAKKIIDYLTINNNSELVFGISSRFAKQNGSILIVDDLDAQDSISLINRDGGFSVDLDKLQDKNYIHIAIEPVDSIFGSTIGSLYDKSSVYNGYFEPFKDRISEVGAGGDDWKTSARLCSDLAKYARRLFDLTLSDGKRLAMEAMYEASYPPYDNTEATASGCFDVNDIQKYSSGVDWPKEKCKTDACNYGYAIFSYLRKSVFRGDEVVTLNFDAAIASDNRNYREQILLKEIGKIIEFAPNFDNWDHDTIIAGEHILDVAIVCVRPADTEETFIDASMTIFYIEDKNGAFVTQQVVLKSKPEGTFCEERT